MADLISTHSNKTTPLPPSHFKKYNPPQLTMFPQSPSKRTTISTNLIPTLATDIPISSPWKKNYSSQQSKSYTLHEEPLKPCLKTNVHTQNSPNMSNSKSSNSCNHLKENELPNLSNINVQNISQDNQENSTKPEQSNVFISNKR